MALSPENGHLQSQKQDIQNTNHSNTAYKVGLDVGKIVSIMTRDTTQLRKIKTHNSKVTLPLSL